MLRVFDFTFALLGLVFGFPLLLLIYVLGLFDTGSPLFWQERVGRNKKPFTLVKFRTMTVDTASVASHLASTASITRMGGFLRKTKLDELQQLSVFGGDYPTHDGTGVRDYIHVVDLAQGHVAALRYLQEHAGVHTWNLGTGQWYSVLDMVKAFEAASGVSVPYTVVDRRAGDIAVCYSNPHKALAELGWQAQLGLERMMADAWRWQKNNPNGYGS